MSPHVQCPLDILLKGTMSPWTFRPSANCTPLVQNVSPYLRRAGQNTRGSDGKKSQFEVSSINESSMEDDLKQI